MSLLDGIYAGTPLNTTDVRQAELDITNKLRSNPLRWNGQFSPQLIQVLLQKYATPETIVLDPFLGSGTVLLESGRMGLSAYGTEINPAAVALARVYEFINVPVDQRRAHLAAIGKLLRQEFMEALPLFQSTDRESTEWNPDGIKSRFAELLPSIKERPRHRLIESLIVLLDYFKPDLSSDKIFATWKRLERLMTELPFSPQPLVVLHSDAREIPLPDSSIDLVLTSPPYINVFNYHQQYRASTETLGWDLLRTARSEIGSNRKHRGNRFLTVIQFCLDIAQVFNELARLCRPESRLIFIVGRESTVRGTPFLNGEIVAEVAHRALGFDLALRQERVFLNRFGQNIFEDILHFSLPTALPDKLFLERARKVAQNVLEATRPLTLDESRGDMEAALAGISRVKPSPIFDLPDACKTPKGSANVQVAHSSRGQTARAAPQ